MNEPRLIVFDLDFTLWNCGGTWCDCLDPPFSGKGAQVTDRNGARIRLYPDVPGILDECDRRHIPLAIASRTEQPAWARELLTRLGIDQRFSGSEIYPSSKRQHFQALHDQTGFEFSQMLFFDDEQRNIRDVSELGVHCVFVPAGMTTSLFGSGLSQFAEEAPR